MRSTGDAAVNTEKKKRNRQVAKSECFRLNDSFILHLLFKIPKGGRAVIVFLSEDLRIDIKPSPKSCPVSYAL
jgi:hypothetical protein